VVERFTVTTDDGVSLVGERAGEGPGLLLVHGFGGAKEDFADHVDALARTHDVVVFDHRGHGESDQPDRVEAYSLERMRADVLAVADACGFERFRLLGHSMGGMIVRRIPLTAPERVDALVLMDTCHGPLADFEPSLLEFAADAALTHGKDTLKELLDAAAVLETPAYHRTLAERPGYQEFQDAKWAALSHVMWAAMARAIAYQSDDLHALGGVTCPTLVVVGEQDAPFRSQCDSLAGAIPGAQLVVVPDAGHSPQFENPSVWLAAIEAFLASVPAGVSAH
jgi:pimeloyl-ACP methyl ester carboxylesterase